MVGRCTSLKVTQDPCGAFSFLYICISVLSVLHAVMLGRNASRRLTLQMQAPPNVPENCIAEFHIFVWVLTVCFCKSLSRTSLPAPNFLLSKPCGCMTYTLTTRAAASAVLEVWSSFLHEGSHALLLILQCKARPELLPASTPQIT